MDEQTHDSLLAAGWKFSIGRDATGKPYMAYTRNGNYFHVTSDSRRTLDIVEVEYAPERKAKTVTLTCR